MPAPDEAPATPPRARPSRREPSALVLVLRDPIDRADFVGLCEHVRRLLEGSGAAGVVVCDVRAFAEPDAVAVDALARLQLTAHRLGGRICIRGARLELEELLALTGLSGVVPVEERGKTEQREQPRGVEEERDPADPAP